MNYEALLETMLYAARAAAQIVSEAAQRLDDLQWEEKGAADFVTDVDRAAEQRVAEILLDRFAEARIVGEELTPLAEAAEDQPVFYVDPLDGTTNYLHGFPEYAVSIGCATGGELRAGVVVNIARGDIFTATAGGGAYINGQRVRVSRIKNPGRALIGTGFPFKRPDLLPHYARQFTAVSGETAGIRRAGSAALDLSSVACGRFDGFWELVLAPWDIAAGVLLVREAGGIVTDLAGNTKEIASGPVVAGNPAIHEWLLRTIQHSDTREIHEAD